MRFFRLIPLFLVLMLSACAVSTGNPPATPAALETAPPLPPQAPRPSQAALAQKLGVPVDQVQILNLRPARFAQACFEPVSQELNCGEGDIIGYTVTLRSQDEVYIYRESGDGRYVQEVGQATIPQYVGDQARSDLAGRLNADPAQIHVNSITATTFNDTCLDLTGQATCTPTQTPGYTIGLSYNGKIYVYHANSTGNSIIPVQ